MRLRKRVSYRAEDTQRNASRRREMELVGALRSAPNLHSAKVSTLVKVHKNKLSRQGRKEAEKETLSNDK